MLWRQKYGECSRRNAVTIIKGVILLGMKKKIEKLLSEKNPIAIKRRVKLRNQLKNKDVTFLCPNCIGGIMFHDLGCKFYSPTVNLMLTQTDFVQFLFHLDDYIKGDFTFFEDPELTCPCAYLHVENLPDIRITFTHYHSEEEAAKKWTERCSRIRKNNLFIFLQERDGLTRNDIEKLATLEAKGIVVFTAHNYKDIPYAVQIKKYEVDGEVGNILKKNYVNDSREYEKYFDFVKWFNEADGKNYDVSSYIKTQ